MEKINIIFTTTIFLTIFLMTFVSIYLIFRHLKRKIYNINHQIYNLLNKINVLYKHNDEIISYCLINILNESLKKEDYETAEKCRKLILALKKEI